MSHAHAQGRPSSNLHAAGTATYVYAVVRSGAGRPSMTSRGLAWLPGAGAPRALSVSRGRWLVVADVPVAEFGQRALDARLKDLDWVSRCGAAHQAVVEHFLRTPAAAVVPMSLFTIFDNDARALEEVRRDAARLDASLDRVAGRGEWVVRVLRGEPTAVAAAPARAAGVAAGNAGPASVGPASGGPTSGVPASGVPASVAADGVAAASISAARTDGTSGRAFLQAKADRRLAAKRAAQEADAAVRAFARALTAVADEVSTRTEGPGLDSGFASGALLDAAFLVPRSAERTFEREARRFARPLVERGFRVSVTGPWPCYSFVAGRPLS